MSARLLFIPKVLYFRSFDFFLLSISSPHFLFINYCLYWIATGIEIYEKNIFLFRFYFICIYTFVL